MARTFNVPLQVRPAGTYGPFEINQRQLGDAGARVVLTRSTDGVWPGASTDIVVQVSWEFDYGQGFVPAGNTHYFGGIQPQRFGVAGNRLVEYCNILWAKEIVNGELVPVVPDSARITVVLLQSLNIGASVQWL